MDAPPSARAARWPAIAVGCLLVLAAVAIYAVTHVERSYDHFVWQAAAFLEGHAAIRYPVEAAGGLNGNAYFQDVLPVATTDGVARGLLPFPPLPALVLLPFVALGGLATNDQAVFTVLAALDVAICWWAIGRLPVGPAVRLGSTVFFAFGTVFWYTAQTSTTWYQAHIVAVGLTFLAIGLAAGADPAAAAAAPRPATEPTHALRPSARFAVDPRQFVVGLLFGLACTARLSVVFGAPFFAFVGSGAGWRRRAWSAGLGAAVPILGLVCDVITPARSSTRRTTILSARDGGLPTAELSPTGDQKTSLSPPPDRPVRRPAHPASVAPRRAALAPAPVCTDPGAVHGLFDVGCPLACRATRDERPADEPGVPARDPGARPVQPEQDRDRGGPRGRDDRPVRPHPLQPGVGAIRLSVQQRRGTVRPRARGARLRATGRSAQMGHASRREPRRRLPRDQRVGCDLESVAGMVTRTRLASSLFVALIAFVAAWLAMLPGVAFWDTGELQAVGPLMGTAHPTGFPTYVLLGWPRRSSSSRSASRRSG
jgi:hypothetical protein